MNEAILALLSNDIMWIVLSFVLLLILVWLYNLNRDNASPINLIDLISINGRISERKLSRFGAWIVSTWGFVYLISKGQLTEWYFIGYMGAWVANALIGKVIKDRDGEETATGKERL